MVHNKTNITQDHLELSIAVVRLRKQDAILYLILKIDFIFQNIYRLFCFGHSDTASGLQMTAQTNEMAQSITNCPGAYSLHGSNYFRLTSFLLNVIGYKSAHAPVFIAFYSLPLCFLLSLSFIRYKVLNFNRLPTRSGSNWFFFSVIYFFCCC